MKAVLIAVALLALGSTALADPAAEARAYFLAGQAAYKAGDFAAAALAFEQANQALPDPATTFSMAQAYRQLHVATHDPAYAARALELYTAYLRDVPRGGRSEDAREFAANLDTLLELAKYRGAISPKSIAPKTQLMVWSTVPGARAAIDGDAPAPLPVVRDTTAGNHAVDITAPGHKPAHAELVAVDGRLVAIESRLEPEPARLQVAVPGEARVIVDDVEVANSTAGTLVPAGTHRLWIGARGSEAIERVVELGPGNTEVITVTLVDSVRRHRARWTLAGGAALGVTALAAFAVAALEAHHANDLLDLRATQAWTPAQRDDYASSRDAALSWRGAALGIGIGAVLVTAAGAYLYYGDVPAPPHRTALAPLVGSTSGVAVTGSF